MFVLLKKRMLQVLSIEYERHSFPTEKKEVNFYMKIPIRKNIKKFYDIYYNLDQ